MKRLLAAAAVLVAAPAAADAAVLPPAVIDTAPDTVVDIAMAPDGTGALVYTKGGGQIWASLAEGASWGAPFRVDPDPAGTESSPRVAAGNGGRVLFGYADDNAANLKWRLIPAAGQPLGAEDAIRITEAANQIAPDWDLDMNPAGVAYAAWVESDITLPRSVLAWRLEGTTDAGTLRLQKNNLVENAGGSSNGPDVRVAVDGAGDGAVLFTQNDDQAYLRRLDGVTPSATFVDVRVPSVLGETLDGTHRQLDLDMAGDGLAWTAGNGNYPAGGHATGVPVEGETAGAAAVFDLHPASEDDNAERPDLTLNTERSGLFAAEPNQRAGVWGGTLSGTNVDGPIRLDVSAHESAATELPVASIGENGRGVVAWTRDVEDDAAGPLEVRARVFTGSGWAPEELLLSSAALGEAEIAPGVNLADGAGSTRLGDTAVLMLQDDGATRRVVVGRYDAPPTAPTGATGFPGPAARPRLSWTAAQAMWSPVTGYTVVVDDKPVATVGPGTTSFTPGADLAPGPHTWQVIAADSAGGRAASAPRSFIVAALPPPGNDTTKPTLKVRVKGERRVGRKVRIVIRAKDAGGIARVKVRIGKARPVKRTTGRFTLTRRFGSAGKRAIKAVARDRSGNTTTVRKTVRIRRR
jgi:hypothetical protein